MHTKQTGFTLIELIMVIMIIGLLATFVAPKLIDTKEDANIATLATIAAVMFENSNTNYMARAVNPANGQSILNCDQLPNLLRTPLHTDFTVESKVMLPEVVTQCRIKTISLPVITHDFNAVGTN